MSAKPLQILLSLAYTIRNSFPHTNSRLLARKTPACTSNGIPAYNTIIHAPSRIATSNYETKFIPKLRGNYHANGLCAPRLNTSRRLRRRRLCTCTAAAPLFLLRIQLCPPSHIHAHTNRRSLSNLYMHTRDVRIPSCERASPVKDARRRQEDKKLREKVISPPEERSILG